MKMSSAIRLGSLSSLWLLLALVVNLPGCGPRVHAQLTSDSAAARLQQLSPGASSVVRLSEAGVENTVVRAFIEAANTPFALSADDLIYLRDIGLDQTVITAMIERDTVLAANAPVTFPLPGPSGPSTYTPMVTNVVVTTPEPIYVTNAPAQAVQFYNTLEPYGTWVEVEDLGWCWQPQIVLIDRTWRPYWQGGRWLYTDLGWYWQSDYSWGCVFHYGRWHQHPRCGWVWYPDPVWAPAWVSWRYSNAYCGWAPLPPRAHFIVGQGFRFNNVAVGIDFDFGLSFDLFNFVEIGHLHDHHPHLHGVPHDHARDVFRETTVANNYGVGSNNRISNRGFPPERFSAVTHQELRPVTVRDSAQAAHPITRPDRVEQVNGGERVLYRSEVKAPVTPAPIRAQRIDERHPTVTPPAWRSEATAPRQQPVRPGVTQSAPRQQYSMPNTPARPQPAAPTPARPSLPVRPLPSPTTPAPHVNPAPPPPQPREVSSPAVRPIPQTPAPLPRVESPRGRDLRLSNGAVRYQPALPRTVTPAPTQPAPSRPTQPSKRSH